MNGTAARVLVAGALTVVAATACGKKGNPLPPLRPVPVRVTDLTAHRVDRRVELRFTVPGANVDGTSPPAVNRIEIYRTAIPVGASAPPPAQIVADVDNRLAEVDVAPAAATDGGSDRSEPPSTPRPGAPTSFVDEWPGEAVAAWVYVVVGVAGRGARAAPSSAVTVPAGEVPQPPSSVTVANDETHIIVSWPPGPPGRAATVFEVAPAALVPLTSSPVEGPEFRLPVEFGRERCFVVRAVAVTGAVVIEGGGSAPACATAVDRYPPPVPARVQAIQEDAAVTLNWTAVEAADLAGYVVLRGLAAGSNLQPLVVQPIRDTTFRDTSVSAGSTYAYAVYAIDDAPVPNASPPSVRAVVTVR